MIEPAAARAGRAMEQVAQAGAAELPEEAAMFGGPMLAQLSPLLMGAQVGSVLGALGRRAFGQFDVGVPRASSGSLLFVTATIEGFASDWSIDQREFRTAVALHEVAHRFEFARPWTLQRFRGLLHDFLSTLQVDVQGLRERLEHLDAADPEAVQQLMASEEGLFGAVLDDEQRIKLARIQSFMAAAEGWADHVAATIGAELLPSHAMIEEAVRRHREIDAADQVFERLLGVEMKRELYVAGRTFADRVAELADEPTLARMWEGADSMPSAPEIDEPRLWLARIV